jgi:Transmembrane secretion effector
MMASMSDQPELQRPESRSLTALVATHVRLDLTPLRGSRDLRLLFIGGGVSFAGSMLTFVAIPYQTYRLAHSSLVVGLLSLAELAALLLTGPLGGVLADAIDRRLLLRCTETAMLAGSLDLMGNSLVGHPRLWVLFAVSFLLAGLDGIGELLRMAALRRFGGDGSIVGESRDCPLEDAGRPAEDQCAQGDGDRECLPDVVAREGAGTERPCAFDDVVEGIEVGDHPQPRRTGRDWQEHTG